MSPKSSKFYCMLYYLWSCLVLRLSTAAGSFSGRPVEINHLCRLAQFVSKLFDAPGDCVYKDLSKAFNKLDHFKLLNKLHIFSLFYALIKLFLLKRQNTDCYFWWFPKGRFLVLCSSFSL
jgi:hypothetical protein